MEQEIWKDVVGFEGRYMVSSLGNVKSILIPWLTASRHCLPIQSERILKPAVAHNGYYRVRLSNGRKATYFSKTISIHRLVAIAFVENPENKSTVNHKDCNKKNNRANNLEWATQKENDKHARDNNLCKGAKRDIRVLQMDMNGNPIKEYVSVAEASRSVGASRLNIRLCSKGKYAQSGGYKWKCLT